MNEYIIASLESKWKQDPGGRVFIRLAEELRKALRLSEAIDVCRQGLKKHPDCLPALVCLGRCHVELGEFELARDPFEMVIQKDPNNPHALRGMAAICRSVGDKVKAKQLFQAVVDMYPADEEALDALEKLENDSHKESGSKGEPPSPTAVHDHMENGESTLDSFEIPESDSDHSVEDLDLSFEGDLPDEPDFDVQDLEIEETPISPASGFQGDSSELDAGAVVEEIEARNDEQPEILGDEQLGQLGDDHPDRMSTGEVFPVAISYPPEAVAEDFEPDDTIESLVDDQSAKPEPEVSVAASVVEKPDERNYLDFAGPTDELLTAAPDFSAVQVQSLFEKKVHRLQQWLELVKDRHHVPKAN